MAHVYLSSLCLLWVLTAAQQASLVACFRLSYPSACRIVVPQSGIKPESPALEGRFLIPGPSGKPRELFRELNEVIYGVDITWDLPQREHSKHLWQVSHFQVFATLFFVSLYDWIRIKFQERNYSLLKQIVKLLLKRPGSSKKAPRALCGHGVGPIIWRIVGFL